MSFLKYEDLLEFLNNSVRSTFTKATGENYTGILDIIAPYTAGVNSRTGHNGLFHFDYDNFIITTPRIVESNPPPQIVSIKPDDGSIFRTKKPKSIRLMVETNEQARCRFKDSKSVWDNMIPMEYNKAGIVHTSILRDLGLGSYTYYFLCEDLEGNRMLGFETTTFSIIRRKGR